MADKPDFSDDIHKKDKRQANFYFILAVLCLLVPYIIPHSASFQGKFIVATERLNDGIFDETVVLIMSHDSSGAWGVIVNQPERTLPINQFLEENGTRPFLGRMASYRAGYHFIVEDNRSHPFVLAGTASLEPDTPRLDRSALHLSARMTGNMTVYNGGPMRSDEYFILHPTAFSFQDRYENEGVPYGVTDNVTVINALIWGNEEYPFKVFRGVSSWQSQQLEQEIKSGIWRVINFNETVLFNRDPNIIWDLIQKFFDN